MSYKVKPEDFVKLKQTRTPVFSPDGSKVAFVVQSVDSKKNGYRSAVHVFDVGSGRERVFTAGTARDFLPKFSPDGSQLGFLSTRSDGPPQLFVIPVDGGEAKQVTSFPRGVNDFSWVPGANAVVVLTSMNDDEKALFFSDEERPNFVLEPVEAVVFDTRREEEKKLETDPLVVKRAYYRASGKYLREARGFVCYVDLDKDGKEGVRVLGDERSDFQGISNIASGTDFVVAVRKDLSAPDPDLSFMREVVALRFSGEERVIARGFWFQAPQVSLTGDKVVVIGVRDGEGYRAFDTHQLFLLDVNSDVEQEPVLLTESLNRHARNAKWGSDGLVYFLFNEHGRSVFARVDLSGNVERVYIEDRLLLTFDLHGNENAVFDSARFSSPSFVFLLSLSPLKETLVFDANKEFTSQLGSVQIIEKWFERDGVKFQGWLLLPPGHSGEVLPVALEMHGGPTVMWSPHERTMWHEFWTLLSEGYAVFFVNPRGSSGYGREFITPIKGDWGVGPAEDIMKGLDSILSEFEFLDKERVVVTGGSYAGYMTAWLATHYPRFKAAVSQRGVYDMFAQAVTCDIPLWMEEHVGVSPWEDLLKYWELSPLKYVQDLACPLLIIHAENDFRVPIVNAEALFYAGKRFGKTIQLVRYPREEHELSRSGEPRHVIDRIKRIVSWFNQFVNQ